MGGGGCGGLFGHDDLFSFGYTLTITSDVLDVQQFVTEARE
jgi:hypothetical protein